MCGLDSAEVTNYSYFGHKIQVSVIFILSQELRTDDPFSLLSFPLRVLSLSCPLRQGLHTHTHTQTHTHKHTHTQTQRSGCKVNYYTASNPLHNTAHCTAQHTKQLDTPACSDRGPPPGA